MAGIVTVRRVNSSNCGQILKYSDPVVGKVSAKPGSYNHPTQLPVDLCSKLYPFLELETVRISQCFTLGRELNFVMQKLYLFSLNT